VSELRLSGMLREWPHLRWHYEQASVFLSQLLRPGGVLRLPGIDRDKPKPEKAYYTLSDFCVT